jgi:integrase
MNWVAPIKDEQTLQKFKDSLRAIDDKYYILFEIGIGTGLQLQDILQFKVKDVRGKDRLTATIGTRQITQTFPLKPELQAIIAEFIQAKDDDEYLITGYASTSKPLSREQAYRIFKQTGNKIGLKSIGTQTMRKTFAWRYYKETGDIHYIQTLLNHASPNITFRYIGEKPNIQVIYDKITDDENLKSMQYLLTEKQGIADIDAIILELKQIRKLLNGKQQSPCFYGRVDSLLEQMHDTIRSYKQYGT